MALSVFFCLCLLVSGHSNHAQEYTLIALVAIAAHLSQKQLGENYGLPMLAAKYKQDQQSLEQVRCVDNHVQ